MTPGEKFGRWTFVSDAARDKKGNAMANVHALAGVKHVVIAKQLGVCPKNIGQIIHMEIWKRETNGLTS